MGSMIFMDQEETPLDRDFQAKTLVQRFEEDQKPIFVIYSIASDFQEIVQECEQIFQAMADRLYLSVNMKAEKRESPGDTLFEVMHQILDVLLDKARSNEEQFQLFQVFRMLENLKKRTRTNLILKINWQNLWALRNRSAIRTWWKYWVVVSRLALSG